MGGGSGESEWEWKIEVSEGKWETESHNEVNGRESAAKGEEIKTSFF